MGQSSASVIGLDIGTVRIGVSKASWPVGLPSPMTTLINNQAFWDNFTQLVKEENVKFIIVGRPRDMSSQVTKQTAYVDNFIAQIKAKIDRPLYIQDEAVTSIRAEEELKARGKPYKKEDIDALSATYILEDYLRDHQHEENKK